MSSLKTTANYFRRVVSYFLCLFVCLSITSVSSAITVAGQIESIYRERASLKVLEILGGASESEQIKAGQYVSFNLPKVSKNRRSEDVKFGNIVVADLIGNTATEYATDDSASNTVMIWNAVRVERIRNPKKYDGTAAKPEKKGKKNGRKNKDRKKESEEAPQIWTQEETVRGKVASNKGKIYIREETLRSKDRGLEVLTPHWEEKLRSFEGRKLVLHGTTHRVSISSGTFEIKNLIKIYPKD
ncbi:MAG: hypothetical protein HQM10_13835 [Candidatus Riflebacteria bacterium]|nr:hypothetical protein [Candidatus Riflebacteria bacterium]